MPEQTVEAYVKAQRAEWGTYVATEAIDINGARAFNEGDPVPAGHVTSGVVLSSAVRRTETADAGVPAKNATTEVWVDYAVSLGADHNELTDKSRDELIAAYAPKER